MNKQLTAPPLDSGSDTTAAQASREGGYRDPDPPSSQIPSSPPNELLFDRKNIKAGDPINIIIFGETGTGKSSIINMISGEEQPVAPISNGPVGCTFESDDHTVKLGEVKYTLWDTAGLNEGEAGSVPANTALHHLQALIGKLSTDGISLLIYCVRGSRYRDVLKHNYELFWRIICQESIPIVIVVTGLENEDSELREGWWTANKEELTRHEMDFRDHACITATKGKKGIFQKEYEESKRQVQDLIKANCPSDHTWVVNSPEKWQSKVQDDIRGYLYSNGYMERPGRQTSDSEIPGSCSPGSDSEYDWSFVCGKIIVAGRVVGRRVKRFVTEILLMIDERSKKSERNEEHTA